MLGVNTIKRVSKKGKLKLQSKLNNISSHVRSRKIKKIIFIAIISIAVGSACYTYGPSRQFILAIKSKVVKFNSSNSNLELVTTNSPNSSNIEDNPFALMAGLVIFTTIYKAVKEIYEIIL